MYIALWGGAFIEVMNAIEAKRRLIGQKSGFGSAGARSSAS